MRSALYVGTVRHARAWPRSNAFSYPVYMTLLALEELPVLDRALPLFGWNRRALTSYHDLDHLDVPAIVRAAGIDLGEIARYRVLTNLRVVGYVFNPISIWWCSRRDGTTGAILAEVSNTFGERHPYLLEGGGERASGAASRWETEKLMHVSPFMRMDQRYTWQVSEPGATVSARIAVHEEGRPDFHAELEARRVELTPATLRAALVRYPLMPQRVTARIHWQALKLWAKRMPHYPKPPITPGRGTVRW